MFGFVNDRKLKKGNYMNNLKKSKVNFLVSFLYRLVALALGLVIPRITMTGYGSSINGLLSSAIQFVGYLSLLEAGIQAVAQKALYKTVGCNDKSGTNEILSAVNKNYKKVGLYYLIGLSLLSIGYPIIIQKENLGFLTVFFVVFFSGLSNVVLFFFQGKYRILLHVEGKEYFISLMNIVTNVANSVIKIVLLYLRSNIAVVVFGSFIASMLPAVVTMVYIKTKYKWIDLKATPNYSALSQNKEAIAHQIAWMVFNNIDTVILTFFCDLKVVSVYAIYKMINNYMFLFSKIPFDSFSFRLGQIYNTDKERFKKYINCAELFTGTICFVLFTVTLCMTESFVGLYTSGVNDIKYVDSILAILFVIVELLNYIRTPVLSTINYAGHFRQTIRSALIEICIKIMVSVIGVIYLGIYGALLGSIVSLFYRAVDAILYVNRKLLSRSPKRTFIYYAVLGILITSIYAVFVNLNIAINNYYKFVLVGGILTVVVGIIFLLSVCILFKEEWNFLKNNVLRRG